MTDQPLSSKTEDSEVILSVERVSKKFCRDLKKSLFYGVQDIASDLLGIREKSDKLRKKEFWALDNVSFELRRGEALGLVGKNGSGKSTLLRIIAGLIKPDIGTVKVKGRIAPLIALGAGFNPILTGRENIYANMSILGLTKQEIDDRFDKVVEFAEIGDAIDAPVQTYSSGMAARLGFATAIHTEPDILLIDEVLAVGDVKFKSKCHRRLHELRQMGTSFILVSHNSHAILNICENSIYLSKGNFIASGNTNMIISRYEADLFVRGRQKAEGKIFLPEKLAEESLGWDIMSLFFRNKKGEIVNLPVTGEPISFCIGCRAYQAINNAGVQLIITEMAGEGKSNLFLSSFNDYKSINISPGEFEIQVQMAYFGLNPGLYTAQVFLRQDSIYTYDFIESFRFEVDSNEVIGRSLFYQPREWKIVSKYNNNNYDFSN